MIEVELPVIDKEMSDKDAHNAHLYAEHYLQNWVINSVQERK